MAGIPSIARETMNQTSPHPAEVYEAYFVPAMFRAWADVLLATADLRPGERVLDIATGTGVVARHAAPIVGVQGSVTAIDMNPAMLAVARSVADPRGAPVDWLQGDALALPIGDASVDVTLCQHALTFFPHKAAAVREMRRVLAPGGRSLTMVLQRLDLHPVFEALMTSVARRLRVPLAVVDIPFALPEAGELRALHVDAGFREVEIRPVSATMRFPDSVRFVPMAVMSSAAAVLAFAELDDPHKASLMAGITRDCVDVVAAHTVDGAVAFDMYAHVAIARG